MSRNPVVTICSALWFACCMLAVFFIWIAAEIYLFLSGCLDRLLQAGDWVMRLFISEEELP
jgi:hypothetical protein